MITFLTGDAREVLKTLPDKSIHCCVTSPPYFGLRDYGTGSWEGGNPECEHLRPAANGYSPFESSTLGPNRDGISPDNSSHSDAVKRQQYSSTCDKCGARRIDQQIGLEQTPEAYVEELVKVFREVHRVLRDDGTLWLNLGDSYAGGGGFSPNSPSNLAGSKQTTQGGARSGGIRPHGLIKPKNLIGIPWMVAFALRADGWVLRQDIIWSKPNPMPESVTDRCTKAHEYIFLLTKGPRYFYDSVAVQEPSVYGPGEGGHQRFGKPGGKASIEYGQMVSGEKWNNIDGTRNKRSVWTVANHPYKEAHFATFPPALIEPCIKAGVPEKACSICGAPWVRGVTHTAATPVMSGAWKATGANHRRDIDRKGGFYNASIVMRGWLPSCKCNAGTKPGIVLDPFGGAGTTALVASRLNRDAILIELNPKYVALARERIKKDIGLLG